MCDFCENGKFKEVDGYETGRNMNIASYFSNGTDGIMMDEDGGETFLVFDNSGGEYGKGAVKIAFCPLCGRKLGEETEKPNTDEIIAKLKENLTEDEQKKLVESVKAFSDGVNGLWEVVRKGIENGEKN